MYECYSLKRFLRLLMLDAIIFGICFIFIFIGKSIVTSAESRGSQNEEVFLPSIMYHSIHEGQVGDYSVTPQQLESDLKWLKNNGYTAVSSQELVDYSNGIGELPEKPVLITLDDGFYNNLVYLVPLLEKYDMHAVVSVVGAYADNLAEADPHNPNYSYLTWDDIAELGQSGRVDVGNHTYNMHSSEGERRGCKISDGESTADYEKALREDLTLVQGAILDNTGKTPIAFAYPYGFTCSEAIPVLKECGFLITLTCEEKPNYITQNPDSLYGIGRYNRSGFYTTEEFMSRVLKEK